MTVMVAVAVVVVVVAAAARNRVAVHDSKHLVKLSQ